MHTNEILEKARKAGLNTGDNTTSVSNMRYIASQVGVDSLEELDEALNEILQEQDDNNIVDNIEELERLDEQNVQSNYENNIQQRINRDRKPKDTQHNKANENKSNVSHGQNRFNKNLKKPNSNVNQAGNNGSNRIQRIAQNLKNNSGTKGGVKEAIKDKAKTAAKEATKKVAKAAGAAVKKGLAALASNPYFWLVIGIILVVVILIIIIAGALSSDGDSYESVPLYVTVETVELQREEFITKTEEYYSDKSIVFKNNAGLIYDTALNYGINPEIVIEYADAVNYSPGYGNNYWLLFCDSEGECNSYASFTEGLQAFLTRISEYNNVSRMFRKNVPISNYWYKPGTIYLGGCYYAEHLEEHLTESRFEKVTDACTTSTICTRDDTYGCLESTREDKNAIVKYYVQKLVNARKEIYGLSAELYDYYDAESYSFWWPIGGAEEDYEGSKTFSGDPTATNITSEFGMRDNPTTDTEDIKAHNGIDISEVGTHYVIASASGKVINTYNSCPDNGNGCNGGAGNMVTIDHGNGIVTVYFHLARSSVVVSVGDEVSQGELLGEMGHSGSSTGQHLHFGVKVNDEFVDPLLYVSAQTPRPLDYSENYFEKIETEEIESEETNNDTNKDEDENNSGTDGETSIGGTGSGDGGLRPTVPGDEFYEVEI